MVLRVVRVLIATLLLGSGRAAPVPRQTGAIRRMRTKRNAFWGAPSECRNSSRYFRPDGNGKDTVIVSLGEWQAICASEVEAPSDEQATVAFAALVSGSLPFHFHGCWVSAEQLATQRARATHHATEIASSEVPRFMGRSFTNLTWAAVDPESLPIRRCGRPFRPDWPSGDLHAPHRAAIALPFS
jgi:hypothetical protein